jgi:hypothetical protein
VYLPNEEYLVIAFERASAILVWYSAKIEKNFVSFKLDYKTVRLFNQVNHPILFISRASIFPISCNSAINHFNEYHEILTTF